MIYGIVVFLMVLWMVFIMFSIFRLTKENLFLNSQIEYANYCLNLLSINDYQLLSTSSGRNMSVEEEFQLNAMQQSLNEQADWLGLEFHPFPRPLEKFKEN
jgi:hypothetical protein